MMVVSIHQLYFYVKGVSKYWPYEFIHKSMHSLNTILQFLEEEVLIRNNLATHHNLETHAYQGSK